MANNFDFNSGKGSAYKKRNATTRVVLSLCAFALIGSAYILYTLITGQNMFLESADLQQYLDANSASQINSEAAQDDLQGDLQQPQEIVNEEWDVRIPVAQNINYTATAPDARMLALPQNGQVSDEYFRTALFIGDSLAQGFYLYAPTAGVAVNAGYKGIGPREIISNNAATLQSGETVNSWDYIAQQTPSSIYIALGLNALISLPDDEGFLKYYSDFLDLLKLQFPVTPIYLNSITPVTAAEALERPAMGNDRIKRLNDALALMATQKGIYFLNVNEVLLNDTGSLREEIAYSDGFHMKPEAYAEWAEYIKTHTVYSTYNLQFLQVPYDSETA